MGLSGKIGVERIPRRNALVLELGLLETRWEGSDLRSVVQTRGAIRRIRSSRCVVVFIIGQPRERPINSGAGVVDLAGEPSGSCAHG